jgi:hypothetical protein
MPYFFLKLMFCRSQISLKMTKTSKKKLAFLEIIMHEILSNYLRATHCFGLIESLALTLSLLDT